MRLEINVQATATARAHHRNERVVRSSEMDVTCWCSKCQTRARHVHDLMAIMTGTPPCYCNRPISYKWSEPVCTGCNRVPEVCECAAVAS